MLIPFPSELILTALPNWTIYSSKITNYYQDYYYHLSLSSNCLERANRGKKISKHRVPKQSSRDPRTSSKCYHKREEGLPREEEKNSNCSGSSSRLFCAVLPGEALKRPRKYISSAIIEHVSPFSRAPFLWPVKIARRNMRNFRRP